MNKSGRRFSVLKKILIILLISSVVIISSLLIFLHFFLKSPHLITFVEHAIEARTKLSVELGSVRFTEWHVIFMEDLVVKEADSGKPIIILPAVEIGFSLSTLLKKEIDRITIREPKLFINLKDDILPELGDSTLSFKKVFIENGEVIFQDKEGSHLRMSAVTLSIEDKGNNLSELKGSLFLDNLHETVPFSMSFDPESLNIQKGDMEITLKELQNLPYKNLAYLKDKEISGSAHLGIDIIEKEGLGVRLLGRFQEVSITGDKNARFLEDASGELEILLTAGKGFESVGIEGTGLINHYINGKKNDHTYSFKGAYDLKGHDLNIEDVSLSSSLFGSVDMKGSVKGVSSEEPDITLALEAGDIPLHMTKGLLAGIAAESSDRVAIEAYGKTSLTITGSLKSPFIHGSMSLDGKEITLKDVSLGSFHAEASYDYEEDVFVIKDILMKSEDGLYIDNKDFNTRLKNLELSIPELIYKDSAVRTEHIDVRSDKSVISKEEGGFQTEAGISISASLTAVPEGEVTHVKCLADLQITGGNISTDDGSVASEGIDMKFQSDFGFNIPFTGTEFRIHTEAVGFELLIGRFYGSFKDKILNVSLKGSYSGTEDSLHIYGGELGLTDIGSVLFSAHIKGLKGSPHLNSDISLIKLNNRKAFDFLLRETFQESLPLLAQMDVGGTSSMKLSVQGTAAKFNVNGELSAADLYLHGKDSGFSVEGLNITIPLEISYPEAAYSAAPERFGSLRTSGLRWGSVQIEGLKAFPAIQHNALIFKEDIVIPVFGGQISLKDIRLDNILSQARSLFLSVHIDGIDLNKVGNALNTPGLNGSLSGSIPKAGITGDSLVTEGEIILDLFGGTISASDLSVNKIFSPVLSLQASITIDEIDLGELTNTFEFGNISGIMRGYVNNLVISNGQAESFESSVETVHRKDVKQWISVKALEKITVLGGSSSSVLDRGIYRLFKKYRYEKIGFKGSLRNDNFHLLGVSSEGNRQYIIKGGLLPPKVDVINYTQNVSFQEMLKRLKRINQME